MKAKAITTLVALAYGACGCGLQVTSGPAWSGERNTAVAMSGGLTMQALRRSNGIVGMRATTRIDNGLEIRSGMVHAGYDFVSEGSRLSIEPGIDFGAGGPVYPIYSGVGAYCGASGNLRVRLLGSGDQEPAYNVAFGFVELVLNPRTGFWIPREGVPTRVYHDGAVEMGLRFGFGSDLGSTSQGLPANKTERRTSKELP